jgi:hypothetical protein
LHAPAYSEGATRIRNLVLSSDFNNLGSNWSGREDRHLTVGLCQVFEITALNRACVEAYSEGYRKGDAKASRKPLRLLGQQPADLRTLR